jgi:hypothetical protein
MKKLIDDKGIEEYQGVKEVYERVQKLLEELGDARAYLEGHEKGAEWLRLEKGKEFDKTKGDLEKVLEEEDPKAYHLRGHSYLLHGDHIRYYNHIFVPSLGLYCNEGFGFCTLDELTDSKSLIMLDYRAADAKVEQKQQNKFENEGRGFNITLRRLNKGISKTIKRYFTHQKIRGNEIADLKEYEFIEKQIKQVFGC